MGRHPDHDEVGLTVHTVGGVGVPRRWRRGAVQGVLAASLLLLDSSGIERSLHPTNGAGYPCDLISRADAARALAVEPGSLVAAERYPATGECVFWVSDGSAHYLLVHDDAAGRSTWPCASGEEVMVAEISVRRCPVDGSR